MATITQINKDDIFDLWRTTLNTTIARWNALGEANDIAITGGSVDGTIIGGITPAAAAFTNVTVNGTIDLTTANIGLADDAISGDKISGGHITCGTLLLSGAIVADDQATTKDYVDTRNNDKADEQMLITLTLGG